MYKCKECGAKYEIKPEYCECGNDTFVKLIPKAKPISDIKVQATNVNVKMIKDEIDLESELEDFRSLDEPQYRENKDNNFNNLTSKNNDKISLGIFVSCLILAFIVLFFIGNPKKEPKPAESETLSTVQSPKEIPALDTFWDNTPIKVQVKESEQPKEEKPTVEIPIVAEIPRIVQQIIPQQKTQEPKQTVQKPIQKTVSPKTNTQQTQKSKTATIPTKNTAATTPKTENTTKPASQTTAITKQTVNNTNNTSKTNSSVADLMSRITTNTQTAPAKTTQTQPKTTTQATVPASQTNVNQQINSQQNQAQQAALEAQQKAAAAAQAAKQAAAAKQELINYKTSLRNTIGRKIDFASVVGDGSCSLSFKIASNGKLTNRVFTKQSSNLTLNEAVYSAMNATPSYNPPPEAYKNETLNLTIKFYNGNFEISLN